jgi:hypothetical protein
VDDAFPLIEAVLGQNRLPTQLAVDVDYLLEPGADFLRVVTTLRNVGDQTAYLTDHYVGYVMGDGLRPFLPGHGFDIPDLPRPSPYFAAAARDVSYSFLALDSDFTPLAQFQGFQFGTLPKLTLEPGASDRFEIDLVVGAGDLAHHEQVHRQLLAKALLEAPLNEARTPAERVRAQLLVSLHRTLTRRLIGAPMARALGIERTPWELALPAMTTAVRVGDAALRRTPLGRLAAEIAGTRYWREVVDVTLGGRDATFDLPTV